MQPQARPSPRAGLEAIQLPRAMSRERLGAVQPRLAWRSRAKPGACEGRALGGAAFCTSGRSLRCKT
eukprot:4999348-Alexandrium_andersonii.AAC.1